MQQEIKSVKVGVGVVVIKDGNVLIGQRINSHGTGNWSFAGGHLEYGETIEECAKRELLEETGLIAESIHLGTWTNDIIDGKHYVTLFVFVDDFKGEVQLIEPHKCLGWQWSSWDALPTPLFPPIRSLIKKCGLEYLQNHKFKNVEVML